ncbi:MAG: hypothetical protein GX425_14320 [Peptococcaceae bacterium]|nr:hypothetical protein [Peptococcaceae bacterium]
MLKKMCVACFMSLLLVLLLTGCGGNKSGTPARAASPPAEQKEALPAVSNQPTEWKSDGKISDNEYASHQTIGDLEVYTRLAGDSVMFGLMANTEGYLALGIDPEGDLKDVDMIMCAIKDGNAVAGDMCSGGKHSSHPADTDSGGKMDLTDISGSRKDLTAVFEFKRKLDTGDSRDEVLKTGENKVIWAVGISSDFSKPHSKRGAGTLVLQSN